jgi:isoaspartyl peptidase/L-asparaginase-like protein (Ntn-hydrolase superfamily)
MENGRTAEQAAEDAIRLVNSRMSVGYNAMGLVAIDSHGRIGAAHNSQNMCWAYITPELEEEPKVSLTAKIVKEQL